MKTLKTIVDGKNHGTSKGFEVKVGHLMNAYFRLVMFIG